ncbi:MAG: hypothetical protein FJ387_02700 [Verrucomicrobia bacterium]|nr:hypothetical protein [Verrucomicrobiota bacterium]
MSLVAAAFYTLRLNPEVRFYCYATGVKRAWIACLDEQFTNKFILCGGSSAAFAVDGEYLLERHRLPLVNFGLHAGMEPPFLLAIAAKAARSNDTLVLALEPGLLTAPFGSTDLAAQMGMALGEPELIHASNLTGERIHWVENLVSLRPGAYHAFTLLGKLALRRPLYRYAPADVHPSGWQQTRERRAIVEPAPVVGHLSPDGRQLLEAARAWAQAHGVRLVYSLPWCYISPEQAPRLRAANAQFLREVAATVPVLKEPALGAYSQREHFADTEWHLTRAGAVARSEALSAPLLQGATWTDADLATVAARPY